MSSDQEAPKAYQEFVRQFPKLGEAWDLVREEESQVSYDEKSARLLKLAIAVGALRQGAISSSVRKALGAGATKEEVLQVVALAASVLGFPATVAAFSWIRDVVEP
jgi:4-carboxymuconolactone decarboxylase